MIDPAILRPGRLDVKIKIERPDAESARDIFSKYITADLPLHADDLDENGGNREATVSAMIQRTVERMYSELEENRFLEVTYANGDKEVLYFKDFNSGAMIQNIVDRAKKMAIKDFLEHRPEGHADLPPARRLRRRVQGERGPAQHHQPRRLGPHLRQEGRADRLHPHAHPGQAGHRGRPVHRHRRQHRPVPVARPPTADSDFGSTARRGTGRCRAGSPRSAATARRVGPSHSSGCTAPRSGRSAAGLDQRQPSGTNGQSGRPGGRSSAGVIQPPHATSSAWWVIGPSYVAVNAWPDVPGRRVVVPHRSISGVERHADDAQLLGHLPRGGRRPVLARLQAAGGEAVVHAGEDVLGVGAAVHVDPAGRVAHQHRHHERAAGCRGASPTAAPSRRRRPSRRRSPPCSSGGSWSVHAARSLALPRRLAAMSVWRVMGTETEYGISVPGNPGANAMLISSQIVNAYAAAVVGAQPACPLGLRGGEPAARRARVRPGPRRRRRRASSPTRTSAWPTSSSPTARGSTSTTRTRSTPRPECTNPRDAVIWDKAGERIMAEAAPARRAGARHAADQPLQEQHRQQGRLLRHPRELPDAARDAVRRHRPAPHAVLRVAARSSPAPAGSASARTAAATASRSPSAPTSSRSRSGSRRRSSARSSTPATSRTPIAEKYRRLHVIIGDANLAEVSTYLKVGTTALVLAMIEDGFLVRRPGGRPAGRRRCTRCRTTRRCTHLVTLRVGRKLTAVQLQMEYLEQARKYVEDRYGSDADAVTTDVLDRWESVLARLETDPMSLAARARLGRQAGRSSRATAPATGWTGRRPRLQPVDLQYSDVRPGQGPLQPAGGVRPRSSGSSPRTRSTRAVTEPPEDTRAYFRGRCLAQYADEVAAASWDSVIFDLPGRDSLQRVPTLEPLRGTKAHVGDLLDRCATAPRTWWPRSTGQLRPSAPSGRPASAAHDRSHARSAGNGGSCQLAVGVESSTKAHWEVHWPWRRRTPAASKRPTKRARRSTRSRPEASTPPTSPERKEKLDRGHRRDPRRDRRGRWSTNSEDFVRGFVQKGGQ